MDWAVNAGGIFGLSRLAVTHRDELIADFRNLFGVSLYSVSGPEFLTLIHSLASDFRSKFHAALVDWKFTITREEIYLLDLTDLLILRWSDKDKFVARPRPWDKKQPKGKRRTSDEAKRILRPHLYDNPVPPPG